MNYLPISDYQEKKAPAGTLQIPCGDPFNYGASLTREGPTGNSQKEVTFEAVVLSGSTFDPSKGRKFRALKDSGSIAMSEYKRHFRKEERFVSACPIELHRSSLFWTWGCNPLVTNTAGPIPNFKRWTENSHFDELSKTKKWYNVRPSSDIVDFISDATATTQQSAWSAALNGYDLLTELAEARETASYVSGKASGIVALMNKLKGEDPSAFKSGATSKPRNLLRSGDRALRKLGGRWMELRYAIMPLVYSMKDITEQWERRNAIFHTERDKAVLTMNGEKPFLWGDGDCIYSQVYGNVTVRSLTKAAYRLGALQRLAAAVGLNPFRTAWELVPMSFVVDWLLNVGDNIDALTGVDYSSDRAGCTAVKRDWIENVNHYRVVSTAREWYWTMPNGSVITDSSDWTNEYTNLVYRSTVKSYDRTLWSRPEPKIVADVNMTWKRYIDAVVLGYQPTKKILKAILK